MTRRSLLARGLGSAGAIALWQARPPIVRAGVPRSAVFSLDLPNPLGGHLGAHGAGGWLTGGPVHGPARFDLLGLEWARPSWVAIELRVRLGGGAWSRWVPALPNHGHRPDGDRASVLRTDPIWTGGSDRFQLRASEPLRDVTVHFVNSTGTVTAGGRARAALRSLAWPAATRLALPRLAAGPGQPRIIARSAWAGSSVRPRLRPAFGKVELGFVHHTETANAYGPHDSAAMVRAIAHYHRDVEGWNDIGYNFLVDRHGQIFEGRAGGIDESVEGAQAGGYNAFSTGVGCLGSFVSQPETARGLAALAHLLAWKLALHGVPAVGHVSVKVSPSGAGYSRFPANADVSLERISGHRDADSTDCPGNGLYRELPRLRRRVRRLAGRISNLSLLAPLGPVSYPALAMISGRLSAASGPVIGGARVELQVRGPHGSETVSVTTTGVDGLWTAQLGLIHNARVRALYRGGRPHSAVVSQTVAVEVAPAIVLTAPPTAPSSAPLPVSGTVSPPKAEVKLLVSRQASGGNFGQVAQPVVAARDGRFSRAITLPGPGRYRIAAVTQPDASNAAGAAAPLELTAT